jgi:hypothetical protein
MKTKQAASVSHPIMFFGGCSRGVDAIYAISITIENRRYWPVSVELHRTGGQGGIGTSGCSRRSGGSAPFGYGTGAASPLAGAEDEK